MGNEEIEKIKIWFKSNFRPHYDYSGYHMETDFECENVETLTNKFLRDNGYSTEG